VKEVVVWLWVLGVKKSAREIAQERGRLEVTVVVWQEVTDDGTLGVIQISIWLVRTRMREEA
jgi:hypothetical protein